MDTNQSAESAGRGLRASVVLASLGMCLLLFWGMKNIFQGDSVSESETDPARKSSFTTIKRDTTPPAVPVLETKPPENQQSVNLPATIQLPQSAPPKPVALPAATAVTPSAPALAETNIERTSGAATDFGSISGRIILQGVPEPEKPLPMDPSCGKLHPNARPTTQFYVVSADGGLADVFIHIVKGLENRNFLPPEKALVLDQVGCIYTPYIAGAQTGQTIEVRNSDPLLHNVHPTPAVQGNKEENKAQLPKSPPLYFRWNNPEVFLRFKCDVHPWMFSYVALVNHPYFAVTDTNGNFTLPEIPPGTYEIEFYHRKSGKQTVKGISVEAGKLTTLNGRMDVVK